MSASGQSRRFGQVPATSDLPQRTDSSCVYRRAQTGQKRTLRPGRLERITEIEPPNRDGVVNILRFHMRKDLASSSIIRHK
jgi:SpoVK/Ycf46/Vps4 family AAA+-type ATPase